MAQFFTSPMDLKPIGEFFQVNPYLSCYVSVQKFSILLDIGWKLGDTPMTHQEKLARVRDRMQQHQLDAYLIPNTDPHQSEYIAPYWRIMPWMTGFTGSAGTVVITTQEAGVWTDSRYFIQAETQLADSGFGLMKLKTRGPEYLDWLLAHVPEGGRVGFDGRLFSVAQVRNMEQKLKEKHLQLAPVGDLTEPIWMDRPPLPQTQVLDHPVSLAGVARTQKLQEIRQEMVKSGADFHLIPTLDDIAWAFNIRGTDIAYNPVSIAYGVITQCDATLFIDPEKITHELAVNLQDAVVHLAPYTAIHSFLANLKPGKTLRYSDENLNYTLHQSIPPGVKRQEGQAYSTPMKGRKNEVELAHLREVMVRDGVALVRFYRWLEQELPTGTLNEFQVGNQLATYRQEQAQYVGPSFSPIVGYAANGAIVHYSASADAAATLQSKGLLLIDSGGQYKDGTTDITRTTALGPTTAAERKDFTLVLKGHMALDQAIFPEGTKGFQLDTLARHPLWQHYQNYGHGTGHGVGYYLNVHEGPQSISYSGKGASAVALEPGMVTTNEPGVYHPGQYGIRTENLMLCTEKGASEAFGKFLGFETLTLFPIDLALIEESLLSPSEKQWLNAYHQLVYNRLSPALDTAEQAWLQEKTKLIS